MVYRNHQRSVIYDGQKLEYNPNIHQQQNECSRLIFPQNEVLNRNEVNYPYMQQH